MSLTEIPLENSARGAAAAAARHACRRRPRSGGCPDGACRARRDRNTPAKQPSDPHISTSTRSSRPASRQGATGNHPRAWHLRSGQRKGVYSRRSSERTIRNFGSHRRSKGCGLRSRPFAHRTARHSLISKKEAFSAKLAEVDKDHDSCRAPAELPSDDRHNQYTAKKSG